MIYYISYKTLTNTKHLRNRFGKIDGSRYLTLFDSKKSDAIYDINCLISLKHDLTYILSHYFEKFKVYSYDSLRTKKY